MTEEEREGLQLAVEVVVVVVNAAVALGPKVTRPPWWRPAAAKSSGSLAGRRVLEGAGTVVNGKVLVIACCNALNTPL